MDEKYYKELEKLIQINDSEDVPVGAFIVCNGKIIASSINNREKKDNVLGHAEINCIFKAAKKLKTWKLYDCDLYVTLKPCKMCEQVIYESRIHNVYYLLDKMPEKQPFSQTMYHKIDAQNLEEKYKEKLSNFFSKMR